MKRHFLRTLLVCTLPFLFSACADSFDDAVAPVNPPEQPQAVPVKEIVYDSTSGSFVYHRNDPYTLDNFRRAYDALRTGRSLLPLTRAEQEEFAGEELRATHYALRIYPRNETEQWFIDRMDDVSYAYLPFDYAAASADDASAAGAEPDCAPSVELEQSPYTVTYDDYVTADGQPVEPMTVRMPVMYVVWPCDKSLPDELDYKIDYEVFLPRSAVQTRSTGLGDDAMRLLELEAVCRADGVARTRGEFDLIKQEFPKVRTGTVLTYDNKLNRNVPLAHLKVEFSYGSNIYTAYTDADGYYTSGVELFNATTYMFTLQHNFWKIVRNNSVTPITVPQGTVGPTNLVIPVEPRPKTVVLSSDYQDYYAFRAMNYFYYGEHDITKHRYSDQGMRVQLMTGVHPNVPGVLSEFMPSKTSAAYIIVYNLSNATRVEQMGTVLHEMGHFCLYSELNRDYDRFFNIHKLLLKSYGSYVGWFLVSKYYIDMGYEPEYGEDISVHDSRQNWHKDKELPMGHFSPLFVDLVDDYNQNPDKTNRCNYDIIKDVPNEVITRVIREAADWPSCMSILRSYVGQYYT
ncbi:MAG: hypothetical protein K2I43_07675, partial [Alistipes sp.]|nr:hypothetical protein [Alistipes sp.]